MMEGINEHPSYGTGNQSGCDGGQRGVQEAAHGRGRRRHSAKPSLHCGGKIADAPQDRNTRQQVRNKQPEIGAGDILHNVASAYRETVASAIEQIIEAGEER